MHPFEMLAESKDRTFLENMLVQAIVDYALMGGYTGAQAYDVIREQVLFLEQRKGQNLSGPPVNKYNDGYVENF